VDACRVPEPCGVWFLIDCDCSLFFVLLISCYLVARRIVIVRGGATDVLLLGLHLKNAEERGTPQLDDDFTMKSERLETHSED
jgi:hypothetical protein